MTEPVELIDNLNDMRLMTIGKVYDESTNDMKGNLIYLESLIKIINKLFKELIQLKNKGSEK